MGGLSLLLVRKGNETDTGTTRLSLHGRLWAFFAELEGYASLSLESKNIIRCWPSFTHCIFFRDIFPQTYARKL